MAAVRRVGQMLLFICLLLQNTSSSPAWDRKLLEDLERVLGGQIGHFNSQSLAERNYVDALVEDRLGSVMNQHYRRSGPHTRQLGDIEFSNRYSEYLRTKAKQSSVCAFLQRMQSMKKSGLTGDTEHVNQLLKHYMCPRGYQWGADL